MIKDAVELFVDESKIGVLNVCVAPTPALIVMVPASVSANWPPENVKAPAPALKMTNLTLR